MQIASMTGQRGEASLRQMTGSDLPKFVLLSTGEQVGVQRNVYQWGYVPQLLVSNVAGDIWRYDYLLPPSPNFVLRQMDYGDIAELGDGTLAIVYAVEESAGTTADILFVRATR